WRRTLLRFRWGRHQSILILAAIASRLGRSYYSGPSIAHLLSSRIIMTRILPLLACSLALLLSGSAFTADGADTSPLPLNTVRAFPKFKPRRPVEITHAGDGSNRLFIVSEQGQLVVIPNDQGVTEAKTFLDIEPQVDYSDKENEEGLLGLAFHPKYK